MKGRPAGAVKEGEGARQEQDRSEQGGDKKEAGRPLHLPLPPGWGGLVQYQLIAWHCQPGSGCLASQGEGGME